ncbi:glycosyltransferase [Shewanella vesiculosa]|uniref:Glycosyltransferase n=1 Tax=Shewanella vesiculosa TaxID=518738 RepID=A0ABV0FT57_9GAMM
MNVLTVAISTVKQERERVINNINSLSPSSKKLLNFLVISQFEDEYECTKINNISVIKLTGKGLSKSRNAAVEAVQTDWIWFQDDDFSFNESELDFLVESLLTKEMDIGLIRVGSLENRSSYYKKYISYSKFMRLLSLKVSSIEIIAKVNFLKEKKIKFDNNLGLGTDLPCCEENKFMLDCFDRGARIFFLKKVLCYHTTLAENRRIDYVKNLQAKGYFLKSFPIYIGLILMLKWSLSIKSDFGFFKNFQLIFKGFSLERRSR